MSVPRAILMSAALILATFASLLAQEPVQQRTYVLVHGAWGGGWDWRPVSDILTSRGHLVFRATLTGLGERAHLSTTEIGLETHITDVVNTILYENLLDVTLAPSRRLPLPGRGRISRLSGPRARCSRRCGRTRWHR